MKRPSIYTAIIFGLIGIFLEFRSIKSDFEDLIEYGFLGLYLIFVLIFLYRDTRKHQISSSKIAYAPSLISLSCLLLVFSNIYYRSEDGFGQTAFKAYNDNFNHGIWLDFKANNNLKIEQVYKFDKANYYGSYEKKGDTILTFIKKDFQIGDTAIIRNDSLIFLNKRVIFSIDKKYLEGFDSQRLSWNSKDNLYKYWIPLSGKNPKLKQVLDIVKSKAIVKEQIKLIDSISEGKRNIFLFGFLLDREKDVYEVKVAEKTNGYFDSYLEFLVDGKSMKITNQRGVIKRD